MAWVPLATVFVLFFASASTQAEADETSGSCSICSGQGSGLPQAEADDLNDAVVTSAELPAGLDPDSPVGQTAAEQADCTDCSWSVVPACEGSVPGTGGVMCPGAASACAEDGEVQHRVYLRQGDGPWRLVGVVCLGPAQAAVTAGQLGAAVRERVVSLLPDARPSFQPAAGAIVNLPTVFAAGEPKVSVIPPFQVLGFEIRVRAVARWEWQFQPGVSTPFSQPGGAWPDVSVTHTYASPGLERVAVRTFWRCVFRVDGRGPYPVPGGEIAKTSAPLPVPVREARSQLVAD